MNPFAEDIVAQPAEHSVTAPVTPGHKSGSADPAPTAQGESNARRIVENPWWLKLAGALAALGIIILSVLIFSKVLVGNTHTAITFITAFFNIGFALMTLVVEFPGWKWCMDIRQFLFEYVGLLRKPVGRLIWYVYIGVLLFGLAPDKEQDAFFVFYIVGAYCMGVGVIQIFAKCFTKCCCAKNKDSHSTVV